MKIQTKSQPQGSVLLVSLLTAIVIGVALGSYLTLTSHQNQSVFRSKIWNEGIAVAEAGIEEALTQIHYYGTTNFAPNGWTWGTDGCYHKERTVGSDDAYYNVAVQPVDPPVITSTAFVRTPLVPSSGFGMMLGTVTSGATPYPYIKRRIQVKTVGRYDGGGASMVAKGTIDFSGQNVETDSFDSSDPNYSTDGMYDPTKTKPNGDVRTNAGAGKVAAINVGNADIRGRVITGPDGVVNVGSGGSVGDMAWVNAGTQGIEPGYHLDDMNMDIPDVKEPFSDNYFTPVGGTIDQVSYKYILDQSGNYMTRTLNGSVLVTGNATLWVTGDVNIGSGEFIQIAPGASLKLYVSGNSATIGGNGIVNGNGSTTSFAYYGLPTNNSFDFKANASFTGTVYAPQADVHLGGGGAEPYDFTGTLVVNSVQMNGHLRFHYDEAVNGLIRNTYMITSWNEVDPN
jgi:hypothetical protein